MSRRLLLVPLVTGPVAAAGVALWLSGLCWPIATQVYSVLAPRRETKHTELDVVA